MNGFEKYNFQEFCYQTINELGLVNLHLFKKKSFP